MEKAVFMQACVEGGARIEAALRLLHRDYWGALLHEAMASIGEIESARDLAQLTLIKVWRHCASFRGESELFPWLKGILRHAVIDWLRARRPELPLTDEAGQLFAEVESALQAQRGDAAPTAEQRVQSAQLEAVYRECAARFARDQPMAATVIRWVAEDDLDQEQIATLLQRTPGATREYISQCRKKARHYFRAWYELATQDAGVPR
jgi:RNA polymerase sigma factor (sigma-70 family)